MALNSNHMENEYRERLQKILAESQRMKETAYGRQTTCAVNNPRHTPSSVSKPSPLSRSEIEVGRLTTENQKLKEQYADLLKKANKLVEAYRELKTENEALVGKNQVLTLKKMKKDAAAKGFADIGKSVQKGIDKIILWFNT